ncbi:unnamed protein product [Caenorhabditis bovis]|uniref:Uncharacterized protein n=1 Tax=Caenorhabditis bovis TaxID=2654633 RepID=A0A8S1EA21_9PELO|nr:unnamed protein product [Caenorhabditis bovis]
MNELLLCTPHGQYRKGHQRGIVGPMEQKLKLAKNYRVATRYLTPHVSSRDTIPHTSRIESRHDTSHLTYRVATRYLTPHISSRDTIPHTSRIESRHDTSHLTYRVATRYLTPHVSSRDTIPHTSHF